MLPIMSRAMPSGYTNFVFDPVIVRIGETFPLAPAAKTEMRPTLPEGPLSFAT